MHLIVEDPRQPSSPTRLCRKQSGSATECRRCCGPSNNVHAGSGWRERLNRAGGEHSRTDLFTDDTRGRTLTAFFDTRAAADKAVSDLEAAGVPRQSIRRVDGSATPGTTADERGTGFFASRKDRFTPEEDRYG